MNNEYEENDNMHYNTGYQPNENDLTSNNNPPMDGSAFIKADPIPPQINFSSLKTGEEIGRLYVEDDKYLTFEGNADESAKVFIDFIINQYKDYFDNIVNKSDKKIKDVLDIAFRYGQIDGAHHKMWVIDSMVRCLTGEKYDKWIEDYIEYDNCGHIMYEWDSGIAP